MESIGSFPTTTVVVNKAQSIGPLWTGPTFTKFLYRMKETNRKGRDMLNLQPTSRGLRHPILYRLYILCNIFRRFEKLKKAKTKKTSKIKQKQKKKSIEQPIENSISPNHHHISSGDQSSPPFFIPLHTKAKIEDSFMIVDLLQS